MFDILPVGKKFRAIAVSGMLLGVLMVAGCGNQSADTSSSAMPTGTSSAPKVPAAGPAISDKLKFDQLILDSPVKTTGGNGSPQFLQFTYTDRDGSVYKCSLPKAMSEGEYTPDEWVRTFNLYRQAKPVSHKVVPKSSDGQSVQGFPFIAPKPQAPASNTTQPAGQ
ncbi:MAG: hypothetical protein ABFD54_15160 [Armatimonadota bacterium]